MDVRLGHPDTGEGRVHVIDRVVENGLFRIACHQDRGKGLGLECRLRLDHDLLRRWRSGAGGKARQHHRSHDPRDPREADFQE